MAKIAIENETAHDIYFSMVLGKTKGEDGQEEKPPLTFYLKISKEPSLHAKMLEAGSATVSDISILPPINVAVGISIICEKCLSPVLSQVTHENDDDVYLITITNAAEKPTEEATEEHPVEYATYKLE